MRALVSTLALTLTSLVIAVPAFAQDSKMDSSRTAPAAPPGRGELDKPGKMSPADGSLKNAKVDFVEPKDGATVGKTFTMKFKVEGLKVEPAGKVDPGTGHFHVIVDAPAVVEGQVIPADAQHIHYGKGQMEAPLTLTPGDHTLTLEFADGAHRAYNAMLTKTIKVHVK